jgi:16S rRNA (cytosine1402-N4)-methyltransferase
MKEMHIPVLLKETIELLDIQPDDVVVDGTVGFGGHAAEIIAKLGGKGVFIGLDVDPAAIKHCQAKFKDLPNVFLFQRSYTEIRSVLDELKIAKATKVLLDLGLSSYQLDSETRGFSFQKEAELDMRMDDKSKGEKAKDVLRTYDKEQLEKVFVDYGELRNCGKFVENILKERETVAIETTSDLVKIIKKSFYFRNKRRIYIKTCAQVFQALRIEVNKEFMNIRRFLAGLGDVSAVGGRLAIITFHSLEDKLIKTFIREKEKNGVLKVVNKKVKTVSYFDAKHNTRARSAKLRAIEWSC